MSFRPRTDVLFDIVPNAKLEIDSFSSLDVAVELIRRARAEKALYFVACVAETRKHRTLVDALTSGHVFATEFRVSDHFEDSIKWIGARRGNQRLPKLAVLHI